MAHTGSIRAFEDSLFKQIDEVKSWLDKELAPVRSEIDKAVNGLVKIIEEHSRPRSMMPRVGLGIVDAAVDVFREALIKEQLIGLCWTVLRIKCVGIALLVMNNPVGSVIPVAALCGYAVYKAFASVEESEEAGLTGDEIVNRALEAFLFKGLYEPISLGIDKVVEGLHYAASDLAKTKEFFVTLGDCLKK